MISRPTWLAFLEPSRWRSTNPFLRMPDYQVTSKLSFPISHKPLNSTLQDATFVETKSDLNIYFENGQDGAGVPCCPTPSIGAVAWKPSYDINEWVGESCLY